MRDKLIELIEEWHKNAPTQYLADYLLENGVIVPPCKVGETVYYLFYFSDKRLSPFINKGRVKKIYCANRKNEFLIDFELLDAKEKGIIKTKYFSDFGKTVFLTREEAEAKLKERKEG